MRCRCCNSPMTGAVRYKDIQIHGRWIEEDFCNQCISETDYLEYNNIHDYQFEYMTEDVLKSLGIEIIDEIY